MSIFRKIFGSKTSDSENDQNSEGRGKYMPDIILPIDERFTINFKANGGKFLYCESLDEVFSNLNFIIEENNWSDKKALVLNKNIEKKFTSSKLNATRNINDSDFFLTSCENLIAKDGSLLISSNQIFEKKLSELPLNFVVFATTSQIVENISEGLRGIKSKNKERIPTNITTIKHFKSDDDEHNFLNYGSSTKNLYLLLLEDL